MFRRRKTVGLIDRRRSQFVVRHTSLPLWWRDPYGRLTRAGDPRSDWHRELRRAHRFLSYDQAEHRLTEAGEKGIITPVAPL
jgi:hypothetical protein